MISELRLIIGFEICSLLSNELGDEYELKLKIKQIQYEIQKKPSKVIFIPDLKKGHHFIISKCLIFVLNWLIICDYRILFEY